MRERLARLRAALEARPDRPPTRCPASRATGPVPGMTRELPRPARPRGRVVVRRDRHRRWSRAGSRIRSNVVASQVALHAPTGGIVPEVAARAHLRWILPVLDEAGATPARRWDDVGAVAVTRGPGLAGSLLVGINVAKTLAWVHDKPLVGVNHLEGHVYAAWLRDPGQDDGETPAFPLVALVVSRRAHVPRRDDRPPDVPAPRPDGRRRGRRGVRQGRPAARPRLPGRPGRSSARPQGGEPARRRVPARLARRLVRLLFSGLKTAARRTVDAARADAGPPRAARSRFRTRVVAELAWGFQDAVVDVLVAKTMRAAARHRRAIDRARRRGRGQRGAAGAPRRRGRRPRRAAHRAPARAVHRQRGDDRCGRSATVRGRRARRPRPRGDAVAAARAMSAWPTPATRAPRPPRGPPHPAPRRAAREPRQVAELPRRSGRARRRSSTLPRPGRTRASSRSGRGSGILTGGLLEAGASVTAVELDRRARRRTCARGSPSRSTPAGFRLIEGDALDLELPALVPSPYRVVANLPYHITSPILHRLLGGDPAARTARAHGPGRGRRAHRGAAWPDELPVRVRPVPRVGARGPAPCRREAFEPAPKVASAVIVLEPHERPPLPAARGAGAVGPRPGRFRERRKMLRNVLARQLHAGEDGASGPLVGQARVDAALAAAGIAGDRRPQTLSVEDWLRAAGGAAHDRTARRLHPGRAARAGQAEPDPRGARASRRTGSTTSTR